MIIIACGIYRFVGIARSSEPATGRVLEEDRHFVDRRKRELLLIHDRKSEAACDY